MDIRGCERIAFSRILPDVGQQVFSMATEGNDVNRLTGGPGQGESFSPCWSPDGGRICFASHRDGYSSLYSMSRDGSAEERLTEVEDVDDDFPAWSPDGRTIAFSRSNREGAGDLWLLDLSSGVDELLTHGHLTDYAPCWSPDGDLIAFRRSGASPPGVYVMPAAAGEAGFLMVGHSPSWSPSGDRIAFSRLGGIWVVPVDASGATTGEASRLTGPASGEDDCPSWSPDGGQIAFEREGSWPEGDVSHIMVMRSDGRELRDIGEGHSPAWSPALRD
jgi:TolB protein